MDIDARQKLLDEIEIPEPTDSDKIWAENVKDKRRRALHYEFRRACRDHKLWRANFLLDIERQDGTFKDRGMNINQVYHRDGVGYFMPLTDAIKTGNIAIVKLALAHGADVNASPYEGLSPLTYAAENGYLDIVKLLIESGADISFNGFRAISDAHKKGHKLVTDYLETLQREKFDGIVDSLPAPVPEPEETEDDGLDAENDGGWQVLNDHTITRVSATPDGFTLRQVFNFSARETVSIYLHNGGNGPQALCTTQRNFAEVENDGEIVQAHAKLVELGGSPGDYAAQNHVVKRKGKSAAPGS